jgi:hypothetical protein
MRQQYFESMKTFGSPEKNMKITFLYYMPDHVFYTFYDNYCCTATK